MGVGANWVLPYDTLRAAIPGVFGQWLVAAMGEARFIMDLGGGRNVQSRRQAGAPCDDWLVEAEVPH